LCLISCCSPTPSPSSSRYPSLPLYFKHFTYPYLLHQHRILGPWTRGGVAIQLMYLAVNLFLHRLWSFDHLRRRQPSWCLRRGPSLRQASSRLPRGPAWTVSQDHPCRSPLRWFSDGRISPLRAMVAASNATLPLDVPQNLFAVIGRIYHYTIS
jgi:hypothetical protein